MATHHDKLLPRQTTKRDLLLERAVREKNWYANAVAELTAALEHRVCNARSMHEAFKHIQPLKGDFDGLARRKRIWDKIHADEALVAKVKKGPR